jgi:tetratricopeptide (TPR) repeat protein
MSDEPVRLTAAEAHEPMSPRGKWPPFPWNPTDLDNPLIGRDGALRELTRAYEDVVSDWLVWVHLLLSDHGLGKSRLLSVFQQIAVERDPNTFALEVRCPSSSAGSGPYRLWDAVLRQLFGVPVDVDPSEATTLIMRAAERWLPPDAQPLVAHIVGVPVDTATSEDEDTLMARCIGVLARTLEGLAFERPLLLIVDDANRASARDFALTSALATTVKGRPVMLVLSGSPTLAAHLPGWDRFPVTRLRTLERHEADRMLRLFLTGLSHSPSRELAERLLGTAAGNSYAIKAVVRWLHETGAIAQVQGPQGARWVLDESVVQKLQIPDTLEGVIHARIANLQAAEREVLAQAAVIGREFWLGTLVTLARQAEPARAPHESLAVLDDALQTRVRQIMTKLVAARFLETRPSRFRGEECLGFRTPTHWEAALEAQPQTTRQRWHRTILSWLELQSDGLEVETQRGVFLRELAHHAEGAGRADLAATYALRAARHALTEGHPRVALTDLDTALRLVQSDQLATRLRILHDLGEVHFAAGATEPAFVHFSEALNLAWRLGDKRTTATALARLAEIEIARGHHASARAQLSDALRLSESIQDPPGVASTCIALGRLHWTLGEFEQALRCYRKAEHLYRHLGHERGIAEVLHAQGAVYFDRGDIGLAERYYQDALTLRRKTDDKRGLVRTLNNLGAAWMSQRLDRSVTVWKEALSVARELADLSLQATLANNLGEALILLQRHDEALTMLERAIELANLTDRRGTLVDALRNLATLKTALGDWNAAAQALARARSEADRLGIARLMALVMRAQGDLYLARIEATGVVAESGALSVLNEAESSYRTAAEAFEAAGYDLEAAMSHERLADLLTLAGRKPEAAELRAHARQLRSGQHRTPEPPPLPL